VYPGVKSQQEKITMNHRISRFVQHLLKNPALWISVCALMLFAPLPASAVSCTVNAANPWLVYSGGIESSCSARPYVSSPAEAMALAIALEDEFVAPPWLPWEVETPMQARFIDGTTVYDGSLTNWTLDGHEESTVIGVEYVYSAPYGTVCSDFSYVAVGPCFNKTIGSGSNSGCDCGPIPANAGSVGNAHVAYPIDVGSGNMFEQAVDYETAGQNKLRFVRYYNSRGSFNTYAGTLGMLWRSTYDRYINITTSSSVIAERADGQQLTFTLSGSAWVTDSDVDVTLTNSGSTWTLTDHDDTVETYTATPVHGPPVALLTSIQTRNGYTQTLTYSGLQLASVTDSYGRSLTFTYSSNLLQSVLTPDGTTINYGYTAVSNGSDLTSVTYPTSPSSTLTYVYGNSALPNALTGITDEDGNSYAAWTYDAYGRGLTSQHGSGADLTTVTYNDTDGSRTVTNALGVTDTYTFTTLQGVPKVTGISRAATSTTAAATETFSYDSNGFLATATDWNGNQTTYVNNSHGDPTTINEAVGSSVARTTTIAYDSTFVHLPDSITTPGLTTGFTYDGSGEVLTKTLTDTTTTTTPYSTNGQTRTWTNTWSSFLLASVKTPNSNTTHYGYDGTGALTSITDPLTHATTITSHTGGGLPLTVVDPHSVTTTLTYDARQRLTSSAVTTGSGTLTTSYTIDPTGELNKTTLPDGSFLSYGYDTAHRVTSVTDAVGSTLQYTLDALGDKTQINTYDSSSHLDRQHSATFDALGRMLTDVAGVGQTTTYSYDKNGNALTIKDPLTHQTTQVFDALNRLSTSTDANTGVTSFSYDAHDRPLSITDPNSNATAYVYDGFGDAIQQASPDSGRTVYHFDLDANLTQKVDALSVTANYAYDALDRIVSRSYPADSTQNVAFTYDQTGSGFGFGVGRLTSLTDPAGTLSRSYDERGNMLTEQRINSGNTYATAYSYDPASRIASITYPDDNMVTNSYDGAGYLSQVADLPYGAFTAATVANITHLPFGPINGVVYGNAVTESWGFDLDYRPQGITETDSFSDTLMGLSYTYDAANNVSTINDSVNPANNQTLGYDVINRITSANAPGNYGSYAWTYDKAGNTKTFNLGGTLTTYTTAGTSNQLASYVTGGVTTTVATNANGNIMSIPPANSTTPATFAYDVTNRLASVTGSPTAATFTYDAFGQRFAKNDAGSDPNLYSYGQDSSLLEENDGGSITDYLYADGRPLAIIVMVPFTGRLHRPPTPVFYYVHDDRLGTPQLVTDSTQTPQWGTTYDPYGNTGTIISGIAQNLRYPGQYFDLETGFNYNLNRDYMPNLGRYLETDPTGLGGGLNTYAYAKNNPLKFTDPSGLLQQDNGRYLEDPVPFIPSLLAFSPGYTSVYLRADDGALILAKKPDDPMNFNCHGLTFTEGQYAINDDQVENILVHDHYVNVPASLTQPRDIALYLVPRQAPDHSFTLLPASPVSGNVMELDKNGPNGELRVGPLSTDYARSGAINYYRQMKTLTQTVFIPPLN
jgi:RHS repeat-associated protein